jgi:hypothetical protein
LSTEEVETLSDIAEHLEELQRHAGLVVSWFSGESTERPALLSASSDLVVEPAGGSEGVRMEVDGASVRADHPTDSVIDPALSTPKDIDDVPAVLLADTSVIESSEATDASAVVVATSASADKPAETPTEVTAPPRDVSGGHRRAERLKNRDAGPRS